MKTLSKVASVIMITAFCSTAFLGVNNVFNVSNASAESFQTTQDISFTFEPTLTVTVSSNNLSIANLIAGQRSDSNIITVTASSNAVGGYSVTSTVGNSTYNYDAVKHTNGTNAFNNLTSNKATLNDFTDNTWGYAYSTDSGASWISGDVSTATSGYNGLPLCVQGSVANCAGVQLIDANTNGTSTISFKIGAKAATSQAAGDYTNVVNFVGVAKPDPTPTPPEPAPGECTDTATCMQTMTSCPTTATTVTDSRDGEQYLVQQLADGKCWMLDNLRLDLTNSTILNGLTDTNTNADAASLTSLKSGNRGAGAKYASSGFVTWAQGDTNNAHNQPKANADYKDTTTTSYGAGSGKIGVYYNYCAASAGSFCYDSSSGSVPGSGTQYDLCPAGWRMPYGANNGEYSTLAGNYNNNYTAADPGSFQYSLSTPLSGNFYNGSAGSQGTSGWFWTSTSGNGSDMYFLYVSSDGAHTATAGRSHGRSVRCLLGS